MADLDRIKRNVAKMVSMNAPEQDIDGYISSEGVSIDDIKNHKIGMAEQPQQSFTQGVVSDLASRTQEAENIKQQYSSGQLSLPKAVFQGVGNVGAGLMEDVVGRMYGEIGKVIPQPVKNVASKALDVASQIVPESYERAVGETIEAGAKVVDENPTLRAGLNIASVVTGGAGSKVTAKGLAKAGSKASREALGEAIEQGGKSLSKQAVKEADNIAYKAMRNRRRFIDELIVPQDALKDVRRKVKVNKIGTKIPLPTKEEVRASKELYKIKEIKPNMLAEKAKQVVDKNISKESKVLSDKLSKVDYKGDVPIKNNLISRIDSAKSNLDIEASLLDTESKKAYERVFGAYKKLLESKGDKILDIWESRVDLDRLVKNEIGDKIFDESSGASGLKRANKLIRDTINDFVNENVPEGAYKKSLDKLSALYTARDNIAEKAAKYEAATFSERQFGKVKKAITLRNMVTTAGILGGVGAGTISAGLLPTAAIAGAGYGAYKGGKAIKRLSPSIKKATGTALQETGKGIKSINNLLP